MSLFLLADCLSLSRFPPRLLSPFLFLSFSLQPTSRTAHLGSHRWAQARERARPLLSPTRRAEAAVVAAAAAAVVAAVDAFARRSSSPLRPKRVPGRPRARAGKEAGPEEEKTRNSLPRRPSFGPRRVAHASNCQRASGKGGRESEKKKRKNGKKSLSLSKNDAVSLPLVLALERPAFSCSSATPRRRARRRS